MPASGEPLFQAAAANLDPWPRRRSNRKKPRARQALIISGVERVAGGRGHRARVRETLHLDLPRPLRYGSRPGGRGSGVDMVGDDDRRDDERLLARAEEVLTEIEVSAGLSEPHAAVLAALRIRLKGDPGSNLDELLAAAGDLRGPDARRRHEHIEGGATWFDRRPPLEAREAEALPRRSPGLAGGDGRLRHLSAGRVARLLPHRLCCRGRAHRPGLRRALDQPERRHP